MSKAATSKSANALYNILEGKTTKDVAMNLSTIVEIDPKSSIIDAAEKLFHNNLISAPVYDSDSDTYVGMFDMRDILSSVIVALKNKSPDDFTKSMNDALKERAASEDDVTVSSLASKREARKLASFSSGTSSNNKGYVGLSLDTTLEEICKMLTEIKLHRLPLFSSDDSNQISDMVTLTSVIKLLSENIVDVSDLNESMEEAGLEYKKDVVCVKDDAPAIEVFEKIDKAALMGIAVVDEDGKLVGNTSGRDIKLAALDKGTTDAIDTDILSYLSIVRQKEISIYGKDRYPVCRVHVGDTVGHVLNLLAKTGYHRVFVVDADTKPVGVVSLEDIIKFALEPAAK